MVNGHVTELGIDRYRSPGIAGISEWHWIIQSNGIKIKKSEEN
jgi:hypothetical protein